MPRDVSPAFIEAFFLPETDKIIVALLHVTHMGTDVARICLNRTPITSNSFVYSPYPFEIAMLPESANSPPSVSLRIDSVDRTFIRAIRAATEPPEVTASIVLADQPDRVEQGTPPMTWRVATYTAQSLEGQIEGPAAFTRRAIQHSFTPTVSPGLFRI